MSFSIKQIDENDKKIIQDFNNELKVNGYNFAIPYKRRRINFYVKFYF